jgi:hypothetical protein
VHDIINGANHVVNLNILGIDGASCWLKWAMPPPPTFGGKLLRDNPLDSYKVIQHKHMCYSIHMCVLYQTTLTKIMNKSSGYRIVPQNHIMALNLNIFKIVLLFAPRYNIGQAHL